MTLLSTRSMGALAGILLPALLMGGPGALAQSPAAPTEAPGAPSTKPAPGYLRVQAGQLGRARNPYLDPPARRQQVVPAQAQTAPGAPAPAPRGRVRIQGRDQAEPEAPVIAPAILLPDTRQQMRTLIQSISTFARRNKRNFTVIIKGGLELLVKRDAIDETRFAPSRTFMRSIDAVMIDGLNFDDQVLGEPPPATRQTVSLRLAKIATDNGLKVFVIDYGTDRKTVDESRRLNKAKGFISTTVPAPLPELTSLPSYPARPFEENPQNILSMKDVRNFAVLGDSSAYGRQDEYAMQMHGNNYDLLIIDNFHGREPLTRRAVETLKFKKLGAKRLVFARINIGIAASYAYYWKPTWREGSPVWIKAPLRDDPDRYYVEFWRPEWQRVITGDNQSYVYGLIQQGFDGVILEGIEEAYRYFEAGEDQEQLEQQLRQEGQGPQAGAAQPAAPGPAPVPVPATAQTPPQ